MKINEYEYLFDINKEYEEYLKNVYKDGVNVPKLQYTELKRAFYAGMSLLIYNLTKGEIRGDSGINSNILLESAIQIKNFFKNPY